VFKEQMGNPGMNARNIMNQRLSLLKEIEKQSLSVANPIGNTPSSECFGSRIFNRAVMQKMLPREIYQNIVQAMEGREKINPDYADTIAVAVKEWAMSQGATHYSHWFQPLTNASAEKHDSFIDWSAPDKVIEKFNGKQLIQGEPDASSFPSGGLRSTYEARGYTGWDPTSPIFLWKAGDGLTLCIPSVFFSWTGDVLDTKIPLLRSDKKINAAVLRLLKLTGIKAHYAYSTVGLEQEYFVVDRLLRNLRPDLVLLGKTVFGASSPKGQELQDHYFGSVKDRILRFMRDFESSALELGIPVKTRHNEVAPAQHEVAPVFEKASTAVDHNILLMEIMRQVALRHGLACLLHEKPFIGLNGSGKHCNWSISTDTGINLLDPSDTPENNLHFLILLAAILNGVHRHSALLRASIASASNDYRLGGHEAPPAILSVYLGQELEMLLEQIEKNNGSHSRRMLKERYNLGLLAVPELSRDNTDRNRTSPFAFTGNKFEFRAVGSSANPAFAVTVLNLAVAESLNEMLDEIELHLSKEEKHVPEKLASVILPVLQKYLKQSHPIRFMGDNYSEAWAEEAKKRKLPHFKRSPQAFEALKEERAFVLFQEVLSPGELKSRYEIALERYNHTMGIEVNLMIDLFKTQILPVAVDYQKTLSKSLFQVDQLLSGKVVKRQKAYLQEMALLIEEGLEALEVLEKAKQQADALPNQEKAFFYCEHMLEKMEQLREKADKLEQRVDDRLWPLPKYRELLFMI
jgi:glutamine synthetase